MIFLNKILLTTATGTGSFVAINNAITKSLIPENIEDKFIDTDFDNVEDYGYVSTEIISFVELGTEDNNDDLESEETFMNDLKLDNLITINVDNNYSSANKKLN